MLVLATLYNSLSLHTTISSILSHNMEITGGCIMFENLGNKLQSLRIQNNFTRKQIAELVGVSVSTIGLYETNERQPSLSVLVKLATQYKVSTDYLLNHDTNAKDSLSLEGLTDKQIKSIKMTVDCFRNEKIE